MLQERVCYLCSDDKGDENYYKMKCIYFDDILKRFIKPYYFMNTKVIKSDDLMNTENELELKKSSLFIQIKSKEVSKHLLRYYDRFPASYTLTYTHLLHTN